MVRLQALLQNKKGGIIPGSCTTLGVLSRPPYPTYIGLQTGHPLEVLGRLWMINRSFDSPDVDAFT